MHGRGDNPMYGRGNNMAVMRRGRGAGSSLITHYGDFARRQQQNVYANQETNNVMTIANTEQGLAAHSRMQDAARQHEQVVDGHYREYQDLLHSHREELRMREAAADSRRLEEQADAKAAAQARQRARMEALLEGKQRFEASENKATAEQQKHRKRLEALSAADEIQTQTRRAERLAIQESEFAAITADINKWTKVVNTNRLVLDNMERQRQVKAMARLQKLTSGEVTIDHSAVDYEQLAMAGLSHLTIGVPPPPPSSPPLSALSYYQPVSKSVPAATPAVLAAPLRFAIAAPLASNTQHFEYEGQRGAIYARDQSHLPNSAAPTGPAALSLPPSPFPTFIPATGGETDAEHDAVMARGRAIYKAQHPEATDKEIDNYLFADGDD